MPWENGVAELVEHRSQATNDLDARCAGDDKDSGHRHPEIRNDIDFDSPDEREGKRQRGDEHRQRHLEHAIAVPEPHVASRERPGRHLHHEDATVTTNPVSAAVAPTMAERTVLAVDGDYCQYDGTSTARSVSSSPEPRIAPSTAPASGITHRLPRTYSRALNRVAHVMGSCQRRFAPLRPD